MMKSFLMLFVAPSLVHSQTTVNLTPAQVADAAAAAAKASVDTAKATAAIACAALAAGATPACQNADATCDACVSQTLPLLSASMPAESGGGTAPVVCKWTTGTGCEVSTFGNKLLATTATTPFQDWTAICTAQGVEVATGAHDIMGAKATATVTAETQCNQQYGYTKRQPYDATHNNVDATAAYRQPCAWANNACAPNTAYVSPLTSAFWTVPTSAAASTYTFGAVTFVSVAAFLFS